MTIKKTKNKTTFPFTEHIYRFIFAEKDLIPPPHLVFIPNGRNVSQNAVHLLLCHALADVVLNEATERRPYGTNVILAQVTLFITILPTEQMTMTFCEEKKYTVCVCACVCV